MTITSFENTNINSEVDVTAWFFRPEPQGHRLKSFPKRMNWGGREYNFVEDGLRMLVQTGQSLVQMFDMSDGHTTYRLKQDGSHWTLVGTRGV
jgi:hypothetical protein